MNGSRAQTRAKDSYQVAVKVFLEKDDSFLILRDRFGDWDLPGGRLRPDEFKTPLQDVLRRKIAEELGDEVRYELGAPLLFMRHERLEAAPAGQAVRIFAIGYEGKYAGGEIRLSAQHDQVEWARIDQFDPDARFDGGWLEGVQEFLRIRRSEARG